MDQQANIIQAPEPKKKRRSKVLQLDSTKNKEKRKSDMDNFKETSLKGHVQLCELRYKSLEEKLDAFDQRLTKVETEISALKKDMANGFGEIKVLLEKQSNARAIQLIATFGTITVAVIGLLGYIITH